MRDFFAFAGFFYTACLAVVVLMVLCPLLWEQCDRKARQREQDDREQSAHVARVAALHHFPMRLSKCERAGSESRSETQRVAISGSKASRRTVNLNDWRRVRHAERF